MESASKPNNPEPVSLEEWTTLLCAQDMPIFSNTAQKIYTTLDDNNKGAMDLASVILQDPNLTAKLLKMSNSSYYNPSHQKMSTVSRAIVVLGSRVIRELTLACSFFESIISPNNKKHANQEIGKAIHAAVQAKAFAIEANDPAPEEVFVAALLNNIGNIAFWCFSGKQGQRLHELSKDTTISNQELEKQVLGFDLTELGKALCEAWHFTGLIKKAITTPLSSDNRIEFIRIGCEIAAATQNGRSSAKDLEACISQLAHITKKPQKSIVKLLQKNTQIAVKVASQFGAYDASKYIQEEHPPQDDDITEQKENSPPLANSKQLQFQILQEITSLLSGTVDINVLFEMVLEGIHRGVEMNRTLFCLLSADKKTFKEKYSLGWRKEFYAQKIVFNLSTFPPNLFYHVYQHAEEFWARPDRDSRLYSPHIVNLIGKTECFFFPVSLNNKMIGLIYTDRSIDHQPLTQEDFNAIKPFAQQAAIGLSIYRMQSSSAST
jgi:HD-like signal output (HDOD) protein